LQTIRALASTFKTHNMTPKMTLTKLGIMTMMCVST